MTRIQHVGKPQRWDKPFGRERMTTPEVDRVLSASIFDQIDVGDFPKDLALADIIANDGRIARYARGQIIVRKGDYGNSLFVILKGAVRGIASGDDDLAVEHSPVSKMSWLQSLSQLWRNSNIPESRKFGLRALPAGTADRLKASNSEGVVGVSPVQDTSLQDTASLLSRIDDVDGVIRRASTFRMVESEMFGELAALTRSPRTSTVFADEEDTELLELRWQGLRDIRDWSAPAHDYIDNLYRQRGLASRLRETPLFSKLDPDVLTLIAENAVFESHGHFDWTHRFQRERSGGDDTGEVIGSEPLIFEQGHYLEGLLLIHSGFARVSERFDHGERTIGYLAKDDVFGLSEIIETQGGSGDRKARHNLRAIGYVDTVRIPTHIIEEHVLDHLPENKRTKRKLGFARRRTGAEAFVDTKGLPQSTLDFLVDHRFINGTKAMVINTDRCINCDDCVRACASTHDGNPRFIRHGRSHLNLMVANACMHCVDAVCLIGCPTGAIHRELDTGNVVIDDTTCVGCQTCANSCPYDNIRMVEIRDTGGAFLKDPDGEQLLRATKCDLCAGATWRSRLPARLPTRCPAARRHSRYRYAHALA